jgi:intein-encoded DNA endonuclease-like protein
MARYNQYTKPWRSEEILILKEKYPTASEEEILHLLPDRTWQAIVERAHTLKIKRDRSIVNKRLGKKPPLRILKPKLAPSRSLAYILGVLKGDGFISKQIRKNGNRMYKVILVTSSEIFAKVFANSLKRIGLHPWISKAKDTTTSFGKTKIIRVEACSLEFVEWYEKLDFVHIRKLLNNKDLIRAFIRGFYDSDGTTGIYRSGSRVCFSNQSRELLEFIRSLLLELGLEFKLYKCKKEWILARNKKSVFYDFHKQINSKVKPCPKK